MLATVGGISASGCKAYHKVSCPSTSCTPRNTESVDYYPIDGIFFEVFIVDSRAPLESHNLRYERSLRRENAATGYDFAVGQVGAEV